MTTSQRRRRSLLLLSKRSRRRGRLNQLEKKEDVTFDPAETELEKKEDFPIDPVKEEPEKQEPIQKRGLPDDESTENESSTEDEPEPPKDGAAAPVDQLPVAQRHLHQGGPDPPCLARCTYTATHQCHQGAMGFPQTVDCQLAMQAQFVGQTR